MEGDGGDNGSVRSEDAVFDGEHERSELSDRRSHLRGRREQLTDALRTMQRARANMQADLEEHEGGVSVERTRLEFAQAEAQRFLDEGGEARARQGLADLEIDQATHRTRVNRELADVSARDVEIRNDLEQVDEELGQIVHRLDRLETDRQAIRTRELEQQLDELAPVIEAQREAVGASGISELGADYVDQANGHARVWKLWGVALMVSMLLSAAAGLLLFASDAVSSDKITSRTVVDLTQNLFVVGLLLYTVRIASLQFRVHRHLEAVARNKSAALSTFNRIVAVASEKEIRNSLALVLAQSVFGSEETGFVDASQDHITLIERVASGMSRGAA